MVFKWMIKQVCDTGEAGVQVHARGYPNGSRSEFIDIVHAQQATSLVGCIQ